MRQLIRGAVIFDGEAWLPAGTQVLIDGPRIAVVGPEAAFAGADAALVDAQGATLLPGLIDCHVHLCFGSDPDVAMRLGAMTDAQLAVRALANARAGLRGGVTSVRDLGGVRNIELTVRDEIATGGWLAPTIRASGRMICITGGHGWFVGIEADGEAQLRAAVRANLKAGADLVKLMATGGVMTPRTDPLAAAFREDELRAAIDEAARFGRKVACHALGAEGIAMAVAAGAASIEHGFELPDEVIAAMIARGVTLVPTLSAIGVCERAGYAGLSGELAERASRFAEVQRDSVRRFHAAGGRIAMGTDAGTPLNHHGENAQELGFLTALGLSPRDALRAATSVAADLCDLPDRGRLGAGMAADLLLVRGNLRGGLAPLADRSGLLAVLKDGRRVPGETRPLAAAPLSAEESPF